MNTNNTAKMIPTTPHPILIFPSSFGSLRALSALPTPINIKQQKIAATIANPYTTGFSTKCQSLRL